MQKNFMKLYKLYSKALSAMAAAGGVCVFSIMILICVNAFSRKLFNLPVPASVEITQSLLVGAIMFPFAYTLLRREHVNTTVLLSRLSESSRRRIFILWMCVGCLLFSLVTYGTFQYALRSYRMNELVWGATIQFPLWPAKMVISLATLFLSIQFLLDAIGALLCDDFHQTPESEIPGYDI